MNLVETRQIDATPEKVWTALLDADVLRRCVSGCQQMDGDPKTGFDAVVVQKVGPVKATFKGKVNISEMLEPTSLKMVGEGQGGVAGFAKGSADVSLEAKDGGTLLSYDVQANVGGKLAQLGSRIIDSFAKKMADDFFSKFQSLVEGDEGGVVGEENQNASTKQTHSQSETKPGFIARLMARLFGK